MSETYEALRAAGLVPKLTCAGCGNKISAHVVPWPGHGYVTHPNRRCWASALDPTSTQRSQSEGGAS